MSDTKPTRVEIDGVLYVPVTEAHVAATSIIGALVEQWWGSGWEAHLDDAVRSLRVVVSDGFDADEGESIPSFVARVLAHTAASEASA